MPDKPYLFPSSKRSPSQDSGFGLVEVMVSLAIFVIAAAGLGYVLVSTNQQMTNTEYVLQNQQYGMQATLAGATGSTDSVGFGVQSQPHTVNVPITTTPPSQPQACQSLASIAISFVSNFASCLLEGDCDSSTSELSTSSTISVPTASLSSSFATLPSNQQPPAWWQP